MAFDPNEFYHDKIPYDPEAGMVPNPAILQKYYDPNRPHPTGTIYVYPQNLVCIRIQPQPQVYRLWQEGDPRRLEYSNGRLTQVWF